MLHADKKNLESGFRVRMLSIREKELMFFVRNCQNMANLVLRFWPQNHPPVR